MNIFQFMSESPMLTFLLFYVAVRYLFRCWNRLMRFFSIRKHGWPPDHCDADGSFKPVPEPNDEA